MFIPSGQSVMNEPGGGRAKKYSSEQMLAQVAMIFKGCSFGLLRAMTSRTRDTGSTMGPRAAMLLVDIVENKQKVRKMRNWTEESARAWWRGRAEK